MSYINHKLERISQLLGFTCYGRANFENVYRYIFQNQLIEVEYDNFTLKIEIEGYNENKAHFTDFSSENKVELLNSDKKYLKELVKSKTGLKCKVFCPDLEGILNFNRSF